MVLSLPATSISLTPHGVSGLKFKEAEQQVQAQLSHPAWGEWIEIKVTYKADRSTTSHPAWGEWIEMKTSAACNARLRSHPAWGEWIEISPAQPLRQATLSHPAWGEWIEILLAFGVGTGKPVSPRMG